MNIEQSIAQELAVVEQQVRAAIQLLDEGATVPFVARYRKEVTGGLDDVQLRFLEERLRYLRELEERRRTILNGIREQGKLTPELEQAIEAADSKARLEDLYLPYKPKRRSKAQIAREAGLEPLAQSLLQDPSQSPTAVAAAYLDPAKGIDDVKAALEGARQILMEQFAEEAELLGRLRAYLWEHGILQARVLADKAEEGAKFSDYFDYDEAIQKIPSHRALALLRGRNEGILRLSLAVGAENTADPCEGLVASRFSICDRGRTADAWLLETVRWAWKIKIFPHLESELMQRLRETAEAEAIPVFAHNLRDLLLAAPAGPRAVIGLDPGLRTGVKVAVVDATGKLLETATLYPHAPHKRWEEAIQTLAILAQRHGVELISIGNGTASRETDRLVTELLQRQPELRLQKAVVSEAGASVYSASELAAREFPDLDVTLRGAVSIARRLQDPLAELVKIEPKAIGVGQYQHDVNPLQLARALEAVVEDCVNAVGVDVNTASAPLLARVAGLNGGLGRAIVAYRDANGAFSRRQELLKVPRLGEKTFEQAAGFLRIMSGVNPLDRSAVHPETYPVVERILQSIGRGIDAVLGNTALLKTLDPRDFIDARFGLPTIGDILAELEKPGRDPRPEFRTATFKEGVETLEDLKPDMILEGVVTNVTHFGAFVDIGVHQDGLVHISALSERFIKDPRTVVKTGAVVKVKVLAVDLKRRRIALSLRLGDDSRDRIPPGPKPDTTKRRQTRPPKDEAQSALAAAFAKARRS
ncbi:MAG: Tex family protein [Candidatus Competibacteraceae bacterium]